MSLRWETRHLWRDLVAEIGEPRGGETLAAVMLALFAEAAGQGRRTSYSRAKTHYERPRRYTSRLYSYRKVVGAIDTLDHLGFVQHDRRSSGARGRQSSVLPTPELLGVVARATGKRPLRLAPLQEPILLRDTTKSLLEYRDNRMTDRLRRDVCAQNEAIAGTAFGKSLPVSSRLRRIFNGDFAHGGRFYAESGGWQTLPAADRLEIELDGEPVVEIDYVTFHPALVYAEVGRPMPPEPYHIPGFPRDLVKIAFNVLLNSSGRSGARHTIANEQEMDAVLDDTEGHDDSASRGSRTHAKAAELIEALIRKHDPIAHLFFGGHGTRLQRRDSDIAEGVLRSLRRRGIAVLPVHDSFLAPISKADLLEETMIEEAAQAGVALDCKRSVSRPTG